MIFTKLQERHLRHQKYSRIALNLHYLRDDKNLNSHHDSQPFNYYHLYSGSVTIKVATALSLLRFFSPLIAVARRGESQRTRFALGNKRFFSSVIFAPRRTREPGEKANKTTAMAARGVRFLKPDLFAATSLCVRLITQRATFARLANTRQSRSNDVFKYVGCTYARNCTGKRLPPG